jgi:hypothetical protein
MSRYELATPTAAARAKAAAATFGAAVVTAMFAGLIASFVLLQTEDRLGMNLTGSDANPGSAADAFANSTVVHSHPLIRIEVEFALCVVIALAASRFGRGAVGDALFGLRAVDSEGAGASRWQVFLNAALPLAVWEAARLPLSTWLGVAVVVLLWLPAVFRSDRRSVFSLATGTYYRQQVSSTGVRRAWGNEEPGDAESPLPGSPGDPASGAGKTPKPPSDEPGRWDGPTLIG